MPIGGLSPRPRFALGNPQRIAVQHLHMAAAPSRNCNAFRISFGEMPVCDCLL